MEMMACRSGGNSASGGLVAVVFAAPSSESAFSARHSAAVVGLQIRHPRFESGRRLFSPPVALLRTGSRKLANVRMLRSGDSAGLLSPLSQPFAPSGPVPLAARCCMRCAPSAGSGRA